jgi:hypothetical protein
MCTAEITIAGVKYVATPSGAPQSLWLSGSQVTEGRWLVSFGNHPSRKLRLDQRTFSDGAVKCDSSIENDLNVAQTKLETYDVVIKYNGNPIYTRTSVTHGSFARWRYVYWNEGNDANATADLTTFIAAKAIPNYQTSIITNDNLSVPAVPASGSAWQVPPTGYDANGNKLTSWDILNLGPMHYPMWDYGGREDIGPYPEWVAQFVAFRNPSTRAYMLKIADLAGSWANHITEVDDTIPNVTSKPNFWILRPETTDGTNGPANNKAGIRPEYDDNYLDGAWRPEVGNAHQPSFSYVPYLITGDHYYEDEMRYWASDAIISWNPTLDGNTFSINDDEIRGTSWGLRDLVDASVYLPDNDANKSYFRKVVDTTIASIQSDAQAPDVTGLGTIMLGRSAPDADHSNVTMHFFLAWSLGHAADQGIPNAATGPAMDRLTRPTILMFNHPQEFPIKYIPTWTRYVLHADGTPFKKADGSVDYQALWNYNYTGCTPPNPDASASTCPDPVDGHAVQGMEPWFGYHAAEIYPGMLEAVSYGIPNAQSAMNALLGYTEPTTWGTTMTMNIELGSRSQWALAAFTGTTVNPPTLSGDLNNDCIVNSLDWSVMNSKWFGTDTNSDLNHDGIVNTLDWSIMNSNWFKTC